MAGRLNSMLEEHYRDLVSLELSGVSGYDTTDAANLSMKDTGGLLATIRHDLDRSRFDNTAAEQSQMADLTQQMYQDLSNPVLQKRFEAVLDANPALSDQISKMFRDNPAAMAERWDAIADYPQHAIDIMGGDNSFTVGERELPLNDDMILAQHCASRLMNTIPADALTEEQSDYLRQNLVANLHTFGENYPGSYMDFLDGMQNNPEFAKAMGDRLKANIEGCRDDFVFDGNMRSFGDASRMYAMQLRDIELSLIGPHEKYKDVEPVPKQPADLSNGRVIEFETKLDRSSPEPVAAITTPSEDDPSPNPDSHEHHHWHRTQSFADVGGYDAAANGSFGSQINLVMDDLGEIFDDIGELIEDVVSLTHSVFNKVFEVDATAVDDPQLAANTSPEVQTPESDPSLTGDEIAHVQRNLGQLTV